MNATRWRSDDGRYPPRPARDSRTIFFIEVRAFSGLGGGALGDLADGTDQLTGLMVVFLHHDAVEAIATAMIE